LREANVVDLLTYLREVIHRPQGEPTHDVHLEEIRLEEQIEYLMSVIATRAEAIRFTELLRRPWWKLEWIVTFLAVLELIRQAKITVLQEEAFGDIISQSRRRRSAGRELEWAERRCRRRSFMIARIIEAIPRRGRAATAERSRSVCRMRRSRRSRDSFDAPQNMSETWLAPEETRGAGRSSLIGSYPYVERLEGRRGAPVPAALGSRRNRQATATRGELEDCTAGRLRRPPRLPNANWDDIRSFTSIGRPLL
jgi:hypothetical protein